jgi:transposase, IS5 family
MVIRRYQQQSIYEELVKNILPDHEALQWEEWLVKVDQVLEDGELLDLVQETLAARYPRSKNRGRPGTPAEVVLRLLLLKHLKDWTYTELEREVRANLVYRQFTRIGMERVPDEKTMVRLGRALGPVTKQLHERVVELAATRKVARGRKLRLDTTVTEKNIRYPTDSQLLGDGIRVITRTIEKLKTVAGETQLKFRDRARSVNHRLLEIARAARQQGEGGKEKLKKSYDKLLSTAQRVVGAGERAVQQLTTKTKRLRNTKQKARAVALGQQTSETIALVRRVMSQTKARVFGDEQHYRNKVLSIFEPDTEAIRKGKANKPTEFGKLVKIQEAENQIIVDYEVYDERPTDAVLLLPAIEKHKAVFGHAPRMLAADAAFFSAANEAAAEEAGVKQVAIPSKATKSQTRRERQHQRWFRRAQRWRVGCEGRISVLKRKHGLTRSRYKGRAGMQRWVGMGVIANNLVAIADST